MELRVGLSLGFLVLLPATAWAIPSPDLVVNFVASAAQVLGLLTVVAGSVAYSGAKKAKAQGQAQGASRWPFRICLVLLLVSLGANVFQYSNEQDARNTRLQTNLWRSSTEAGKKVGDVNLKTLSISEQEKRPEAITTQILETWIAEKKPLNLIDVREPEEVEMGTIPGTWHRRYPDLFKDRTNLVVEGKETILLCESGNRSGELCGEFLKEKLPCRFMIGGYEKWVAEGRELVGARERSGGEIRDIPDYTNKGVLLDTPDVMASLQTENPLFVDVRYPGDFELGHLPNAVNLPLRKMLSAEIEPALRGLPRRPIIAPCYDKRSSFYAMILGLRLSRLGYDFRGRYTVPHELAVKTEDKAWVTQWKEAQQGKTILGMVAAPLSGALEALTGWTGSFAAGVVLLVIALRLLVLPLALKADRDQIIQKRLKPKLEELKGRIGSDPQRFSRAMLRMYREERLTLGRNLAGTVAILLLFIVFFTVVNDAAASSNEALAWIPSLASPDPLYILPALTGGLVFVLLFWNAEKRSAGKLILHLVCAGLLAALTLKLRAAVGLYLAVNLTLIILQGRLVRWSLARGSEVRRRSAPEALKEAGIVGLKLAHHVPGAGNKAIRLGRMMEAGIPVPDGFVVTDKLLSAGKAKIEQDRPTKVALSAAWKSIQAQNVAVRSSGLNEDGSNKSYAGVFESILNVPFERLTHAIEEVRGSLQSSRVTAYSGLDNERGGILVQKMVPAEYAGVLFTEHPASTGCMLVELVKGLGDALVSGAATPTSYRFGRVSGANLEECSPPIDLTGLIELGRKVEETFGRPQDIEWAFAQGKFFILQARDITTSCESGLDSKSLLEKERKRVLELAATSLAAATREGLVPPGEAPAVFVQNELSELLPRPTPFSLSLMETLWAPGGSTDLACRSLGIPYDAPEAGAPYVNTLFGNLFVNALEGARRFRRGPGAAASFRLARMAKSLELETRETFNAFEEEVRLREALDLGRLSTAELFKLLPRWTQGFVTETYVQAERVNIAADFYMKEARAKLEKRGLDASIYLGNLPETVVHRAMSLLPLIQSGHRQVEDFLALFGHRAPNDYELSQPRYSESPQLVEQLASRALATTHASPILAPPEGSADKMFLLSLERARSFQVLKEEAKHAALRELALIRRLAVEIGRRLELGSDLFLLTLEEVQQLAIPERVGGLFEVVARRKREAKAFKQVRVDTSLRLPDLESLGTDDSSQAAPARGARSSGGLKGVKVAGAGSVSGRVRVITDPADIDSFQKGEILVARFTDPTWTPLFPVAGGVVTEVGGWLSHAAIVAREYGVPCIVGAAGAMSRLKTGDEVELHADGTVHLRTAEERRRAGRLASSAQVALEHQGKVLEALLRNISTTGALLSVEKELADGEKLALRLPSAKSPVQGKVVRRERSGDYAIRFNKPVAEHGLPQDGPSRN